MPATESWEAAREKDFSRCQPWVCWDGFHAEAEDRLYLALINGSLAVIDDVSQLDLMASTGVTSLGADVLDRIITVVDADGTQQSVNFHGVSAENGRVLDSDVGSADSPTDGSLYLFSDDGNLNGEVTQAPVTGPATMLGNPADVLLIDGDAIVAEKFNNAILVFNEISGRSGDVMPDYQLAFAKPESLAALGMDESIQYASDIVSGDNVSRLLIAQNPGPQQDTGMGADNTNVGRIALIDAPADADMMDTDYDAVNDRLYATGTGGDVLVHDDFFAMGASAVPTRSSRPAASEMTSNIHGIAYDEASDTVLATDVGDAASATDGSFYIIDNASTASGAVTPVATVSGALSMHGNPVDIAFDGSSAYIAEKSNDAVLVYRNVMDIEGSMDKAADEFIAISKPESVTLQKQ